MQNMFLKIGDKSNPINGECTDMSGTNTLGKQGHKDWVEVLSFHHGIEQSASPIIGSTQGRTIERCQHEDFAVTKYVDLATPQIHLACCNGSHIDLVILETYRASGYGATNQPVMYLCVTMKDVIVSSVKLDSQERDIAVEKVTFAYGSITWRYEPQYEKAGASPESPTAAGWDVVQNQEAS